MRNTMRNTMRVAPAVVLLVAVWPASSALASAAAGSVGHDVSYPQCTAPGATTTTVGSLGGAFGVVGVTGGRPWGPNSCSSAEFSWAAGLANPAALYMNTANPAPTSSYYWPTSGSTDPVLCINAASTTDPGCAYDYGWHAAANALLTQAAAIPNAATVNWWLDVETANSWNGDGTSNAADLQGSTDYLRSHGVGQVGLYSTSAQWTTITGGYTTATAASYASAWQPEFTAQYPMTSDPVWVAGLGTATDAATACGTTFTGAPTQLAQFDDGSGYDADLVCGSPAPTAQAFTLSLSPTSGTVKRSGTLTATLTVTESGATQSVALSSSGAPTGVTVTFSPQTLAGAGTSAMQITVAAGAPRGSYPITVTGTGTSSPQSVRYTLKILR